MSNELKVTFVGGADHLGDARSVGLDASVLVGRSHKAGIRFTEKDRDVSGVHLEIRPEADGVYAVAVKEYVLNERDRVAGGEMRKLAKGDVLTLGPRSRAGLRIDALPTSGSRSAGADEAATGATRFTSATGATRFTSATGATRVSLTDATHASLAGATGLTSFGDAEAMRPTRFADGESVAGDAVAGEAVDDGETVAMDRVTRDSATGNRGETEAIDPETLKRMMADAATASGAGAFDRPTGAMTGMASDSATSDSVSTGAGIDKTIALPQGGQETINIAPSQLLHIDPNAPKRFRKRLMAFSIIGFAAILGVVIYSRMNHEDRFLSHPGFVVSTFKDAEGRAELDIDYPWGAGSHKDETATSLKVATLTGKNRQCPFNLDFSISRDPNQINLSLEESAERDMADLTKKGYAFAASADDGSVSPEERAGFFFYEDQHPRRCQVRLPRGTRFFRREYAVSRNNRSWWGVYILLRDGDRVYRLFREIPENQKPRGKYLLIYNPNLSLYGTFLRRRWDSSGKNDALASLGLEELKNSTRALLKDGCLSTNWGKLADYVNAMMIMTYGKANGDQKEVRELRSKFLALKDQMWGDLELERDVAIRNGEFKRLESIGKKCRSEFGNDPRDWRFKRSNDAKEWPWEIKAR